MIYEINVKDYSGTWILQSRVDSVEEFTKKNEEIRSFYKLPYYQVESKIIGEDQ